MTTAREFTTHLVELLRCERHAMANFLLALADFDRRRLWIELGHASLFSFLRRELGLSAGAAQYRKTAAELVQRYPEVEAALRTGKLCLSSVIEVAKVITAENVAEILPRFFGLSSRDAAVVAVSIRPVEKPPVRDVIVPLGPAPRLSLGTREALVATPLQLPPASAEAGELQFRAPEPLAALSAAVPSHTVPAPKSEPKSTVEPLDADRARLHITVSRRFLAKLEAAKAELSHARPGATSEEILEAALDALLVQRAKRKGIVEKPRASQHPANPETVSAAVSREVWARSGSCCEWPLESGDSGGVCGSTLRLQVDHINPRALGGPSTIGNLRILCAAHNRIAAREVFGDAWMDRFTRKGRAAESHMERGRGRTVPDLAPRTADASAGSLHQRPQW